MGKRFTETEKWRDDWFLSLSNDNKVVFMYLVDNCNHAGMIKKEFHLLNHSCAVMLDDTQLLKIFSGKVFDCNDFYFIPNFLKHQYPQGLGSNKPAVVSARKMLEDQRKHQPIRQWLDNHCTMIKDKDKDTDKPLSLSFPVVASSGDKRGVGGKGGVIATTTPQAEFVTKFKQTYESLTGQPFKVKREHFVIAARLIKEYGIQTVHFKAGLLAGFCQKKSTWFTKGGWADFSIEKLSSQWNAIIPEAKEETKAEKEAKEMHDIREKRRIQNERVKSIMDGK